MPSRAACRPRVVGAGAQMRSAQRLTVSRVPCRLHLYYMSEAGMSSAGRSERRLPFRRAAGFRKPAYAVSSGPQTTGALHDPVLGVLQGTINAGRFAAGYGEAFRGRGARCGRRVRGWRPRPGPAAAGTWIRSRGGTRRGRRNRRSRSPARGRLQGAPVRAAARPDRKPGQGAGDPAPAIEYATTESGHGTGSTCRG